MFWHKKPLSEMSEHEWESLCDGCGRCCMQKFEDAESDDILYTNIRCHLFNDHACRCNDYLHRTSLVPDCMEIRQLQAHQFSWLPNTCAYRLLHEGKPLFDWHPLISGNPDSTHQAGISLQHQTACDENFSEDEIIRHIISCE